MRKYGMPQWSSTILMLLLSAVAGGAQGQIVLSGEVFERFDGRIPQSGGGLSVVGVIQGPPRKSVEIRSLRAYVPAGLESEPMCLEASTFDGSYYAEGSLAPSKGPFGPAALKSAGFSRHGSDLFAYRSGQLAVLFVVGKDCRLPTKQTPLTVALMDGNLDVVQVAVNFGGEAKNLEVTIEGRTSAFTGKCLSFGEGARVYKYYCDIPIDRAEFDKAPATLTVKSKIGGAPSKQERFKLFVMGAGATAPGR